MERAASATVVSKAMGIQVGGETRARPPTLMG
jgi:hypothetical protein